jgi:hypothetical protein
LIFCDGVILSAVGLPLFAGRPELNERHFVHTEEVTGSIPVSPTQVRGPVRDLRAGLSPLYSSEVQLRLAETDASETPAPRWQVVSGASGSSARW